MTSINKRTESTLPNQVGTAKRWSGLIIIFLAAIAFGGWMYYSTTDNKNEKQNDKDHVNEVSVVKKNDFSFKEKEQESIDKEPPFVIGEPMSAPKSNVIDNISNEEMIKDEPPIVSKSSSGMMVAVSQSPASSASSTADNQSLKTSNIAILKAKQQLAALTQQEQLQNQVSNSSSSSGDFYDTPVFQASVAKKSTFNPSLLLSKGTIIQCSLRGKLVSNIGGQIGCVVSDNVLSENGAVVLIEKGSLINGFYQGNGVSHGANQIFAVWNEIRTPNNLVIPLNSGGGSSLGVNGITGWTDDHFWQRIKSAVFLSFIQDASGAIANRISKSDNYDYTQNTRDNTENVATEFIKQMGDIKPTLYVNQGSKVSVLVARDVDFSKVYKLEIK